MKQKFYLFAMLFMALSFVACGGSDDDENGKSEEQKEAIRATNSYFAYPYMGWGASMTTVKSVMSSFTISRQKSDFLAYEGKLREEYIAYSFEDNELVSSAVAINCLRITAEDLLDILKTDGYEASGKTDDIYIFLSSDNSNVLAMSVESTSSSVYYLMMWVAKSTLSKARSRSNGDDIATMKMLLEEHRARYQE